MIFLLLLFAIIFFIGLIIALVFGVEDKKENEEKSSLSIKYQKEESK